MAQRPFTNAKMYAAPWTERDEATLIDLLNRKINELKFDIKDADSPYIKAQLKAKRKEYKAMLAKVISGDYNGEIIANELAAANAYRRAQSQKAHGGNQKIGKYVDQYSDMNFDYKSYFHKTRYYGAALPFVMLLLIVLLGVFIVGGMFLPSATINSLEETISSEDTRMTVTSIAYFKLGPDEMDFRIKNDGNWPKGTFEYEANAIEYGVKYKDANGLTPEYVYLYKDLRMVSIDITAQDVFKALFRLPMFNKNRVDLIEDMDAMQGRSWYYLRYMVEANRFNTIELTKSANGGYDGATLVRHVATYGLPLFMWITIILLFVELVLCVVRLFTYTSRRLHVIPILVLVFGLISFFCPAFAEISDLNGETVGNAINSYFTIYWSDFLYADGIGQVVFNLLYMIVLLAVPVLLIVMPLLFKNREPKKITFVPKGNRPHFFTPNEALKPGSVPKTVGGMTYTPQTKSARR